MLSRYALNGSIKAFESFERTNFRHNGAAACTNYLQFKATRLSDTIIIFNFILHKANCLKCISIVTNRFMCHVKNQFLYEIPLSQ